MSGPARIAAVLWAGAALSAFGAGDWYAAVQGRYEEGLSHMREARAGAPEMRLERYTKALDAFEEAKKLLSDQIQKEPSLGDRYRGVLTEINSCIFWASRFRPAPGSDGKPRPPAAKPPAASLDAEARALLAEAEDFATKHPEESFRAAIRFFEVVERYRGTPAGVEAMAACIDRMQAFLEAHQFEGASERLAPAPEPAGPRAPAVDAQAVEGWIRKIRTECRERGASSRKRDEAAAEMDRHRKRIEELTPWIESPKPGTTTDQHIQWIRERDALRDREIPKLQEKIGKLDRKLAQNAEEIAEASAKLARAGPGARPLVEKGISDPGTSREAMEELSGVLKRMEAE